MKKQLLILVIFAAFTQTVNGQINLKKIKKAIGVESVSTEEVAAGLKEALTNGASKGSDKISQVDGYFKNPEIKIPFPPETKQVETKLRQMGMGGEVDKFILALNRGAEDAAKEAKPIFVSAIQQMTIDDAWKILRGEKDEATQYLKRTTTPQLTEKFKPVIKASLEKVNATKYYSDLVNTYNKIPFVTKVNPNLDDYATGKAIDGVFVMIAKEEKLIRDDPGARTTDLLKKVFSQK
jgi:hypothetical protein